VATPDDLALAEVVTQAAAIIITNTTEAEERTQADAALEESEARYRTLFESIDQGFSLIELVHDAEGRTVDFRFLEVNPAFMARTGLGNVVGKLGSEVVTDIAAGRLEIYDCVARTGIPYAFEYLYEPTGRWLTVYASRHEHLGKQRISIIFTDITERRLAEETLRANEEQQAFLLRLADALRPLADARQAEQVATHLLGEQLQVDYAMYNELRDDGKTIHIEDAYVRGDLPKITGDFPVQALGAAMDVLRRGEPLIIEDQMTTPLKTPLEREVSTGLGVFASATVPLIKDGRWVANFGVLHGAPRQWTPSEITILHEAAERTWTTVQRIRSEAALRESEARYRTLFEAIDEGFARYEVLFDAAGQPIDARIHEVNPAYQRLTGRSDPAGKRLNEVSPGLDAEWGAAMAEVVLTGRPARFEGWNAEIDRWFDVFIGPMDGPGDPHIVLILNDITERKRATRALRDSEERQAFLLAVSDTLRPLSDPGAVQGVAMRMLGEQLGCGWAYYGEFNHPLSHMTVRQCFTREGLRPLVGVWPMASFAFAEQMAAGGLINVPDMTTHPEVSDGTRAQFGTLGMRAFASAPIVKGGILRGGVVAADTEARVWTDQDLRLIADVAERTWAAVEQAQAETALRESEERYRLIVDQATDYAIFSTDAERRIETWPPGAAAVFGWTAEEAVGQLMDITFIPADRAEGIPEGEFAQARDTGHAPDVRWHLRKDGTYVFIEGDAYARSDGGGVFQGVFKIGQDVTGRLAAEEAQREEEAVRREDEATLREELGIQVQTATAELRTLSRRLLQVQEEERRNLALELHDEIGQVLTGLTFQLAAAAGGVNGAQALTDAQTTVRALTEQVRQMALDLRPQVLDRYGLLAALEWHIARFQAKTGITVHLRHQGLEERFPPEVEIAAFRVVQEALTNVARHAGTDFATVQVYGGDGVVTLVIRDTGRGFDVEQGGASTGLGGMRERVELLGGRLEIDAMPGGGTAVIAELPGELATEETP
jgi:PAS domain S-box-containing protein